MAPAQALPGPQVGPEQTPPAIPLGLLAMLQRRWRTPVPGASTVFPRGSAPVKREAEDGVPCQSPSTPGCFQWLTFQRGPSSRKPSGFPRTPRCREWISACAFVRDRSGLTAAAGAAPSIDQSINQSTNQSISWAGAVCPSQADQRLRGFDTRDLARQTAYVLCQRAVVRWFCVLLFCS